MSPPILHKGHAYRNEVNCVGVSCNPACTQSVVPPAYDRHPGIRIEGAFQVGKSIQVQLYMAMQLTTKVMARSEVDVLNEMTTIQKCMQGGISMQSVLTWL